MRFRVEILSQLTIIMCQSEYTQVIETDGIQMNAWATSAQDFWIHCVCMSTIMLAS